MYVESYSFEEGTEFLRNFSVSEEWDAHMIIYILNNIAMNMLHKQTLYNKYDKGKLESLKSTFVNIIKLWNFVASSFNENT